MLIENVLGVQAVDAVERRVEWRRRLKGPHGLKRLRFGTVVADLESDGPRVTVTSNAPFTLVLDGKPREIRAGTRTIDTA